jgi:hydroxymethylpyrimidine/phosphomethylpyrimidine kinase
VRAADHGAERPPTALSIAGSDSGGGAGIQADLKAFARCGVHGATAITAITAQSTVAVDVVHPIPGEVVLAQVRTVLADIVIDAVKVGMLATAEVAAAVGRALAELAPGTPVVLDPVMVAESGARLLDGDAERVLVEDVIPRATVITPNLPEARVLAGFAADERETAGADGEQDEARALARGVLALGPRAVVLTGGHRERAVDLLLDGEGDGTIAEIAGVRHPDGAAHGSGCTHSSVLAAQLALGRSLLEAAMVARRLTGEAIAGGLRDLGAGAGPVDVLDIAAARGGRGPWRAASHG